MDVINITITASSKLYPDFSPNILYKNQFNLFLKSSFFTVVKFMWVFYCIKIKHVHTYFVNLHNKCWLVYWSMYMYMRSCSQVIIIKSKLCAPSPVLDPLSCHAMPGRELCDRGGSRTGPLCVPCAYSGFFKGKMVTSDVPTIAVEWCLMITEILYKILYYGRLCPKVHYSLSFRTNNS